MRRRTLVALLAFVAFVSLGLPDGLIGVAWPSIRTEFGVPLDALGLLVSFTVAGYLASSFLGGSTMRLLSLGALLSLSTAAAATALLGFALADAWWQLLACGFLAGVGGGAIDAGLNAYGAKHFSARTLNWMHAFFGLGSTIGPLVVTAVLGAGLVWKWSYAIVGGAQVLLAITFWFTRGAWAQAPEIDDADAPSAPAAAFLDTLRRPVVWLGMLLFFVYTGIEATASLWSYSLLTLDRGVSRTLGGLAVTLYWASLMVGRIAFGIIADRVPLIGALRVCIVGSIVAAAVFWIDFGQAWSLLGLMALGFFLAPIFASLISLTPARVGLDHADSAIGFQIGSAGLGAAVLPAIVGVLAHRFGLEAIGLSIVCFAVLLLVLYECFMGVGARRTTVATT